MYFYLLIWAKSSRKDKPGANETGTYGRMEGGWKNEGMRTERTIPKDNICCLNEAKITVLLTESE